MHRLVEVGYHHFKYVFNYINFIFLQQINVENINFTQDFSYEIVYGQSGDGDSIFPWTNRTFANLLASF
jgi:hypothetical protein